MQTHNMARATPEPGVHSHTFFEESGRHLRTGDPDFDDPSWVHRKAKLFESGDFPDKGVTISPEQLVELAANFKAPAPVLIEHASNPLELGFLVEVQVEGNELFGTLALSQEANALIEKSGARGLSIGLSPDITEIEEVSLVRNPRVSDARLFSYPNAILDQEQPEFPDVSKWLNQGQILPCQVPYLRAMMGLRQSVTFDGESVPIAKLLIKMIEQRPPVAVTDEIVPDFSLTLDASASLLLPEEAAFYKRYFPGVSLAEIAQRRFE